MKNRLLWLLLLLPLSCLAQIDVPGLRTNSQWLNASLLQIGYVPIGRLGTNTGTDGYFLEITGNRMKWVPNGTFTGLTNLSLTANTIIKAGADKQEQSIPNGTGSLTNDGSGIFGWWNPSFILNPGNSAGFLKNNGSGTLTWTPTMSFTNLIDAFKSITNAAPAGGVVDLNAENGYSVFVTNASFNYTGFLNRDFRHRQLFSQVVSNSGASSITVGGMPNTVYSGQSSTNSAIIPSAKTLTSSWWLEPNWSNCVNVIQQ